MKYAVFTVMLPDLTPEEAVAELAQAGYDGVEWRVTRIPPDFLHEAPSFWRNNLCTLSPTLEDAQRARSLAANAGLSIPNLGTYLQVGDLPAVEEAMTFAVAVGAPSIRVGVARPERGQRYQELYANNVHYLAGVESLARRFGVKALIEIHHGTIAPSASLAHRLVCHFDPARIGVIHDAGNMVHEGFEDYRTGLELLGPYLGHVHVKNAAFQRPTEGGVWRSHWAPLNDGVVDFLALWDALRNLSYDGWVTVEDFSQAYPSRDALRANIEFLRRL
jgi:sugar phosphate isomerase/epimerase